MRIYHQRLRDNQIPPVKFDYNIPPAASTPEQKSRHKLRQTKVHIYTGYADDTTIYQNSEKDLEKALKILAGVYSDFQLTLNIGKIKSMIFNCQSPEYPTTILKFGEEDVENVETFNFLGSQIHQNQVTTGKFEIDDRISKATSKFFEYEKILKNYNLKLSTRMVYFNAYVRSRLLYTCQGWNLNKSKYERLNACHRKFLRSMVRGGWGRKDKKNADYTFKISTARLYQICHCTEVSDFIKNQQKKYAGHLIRKENNDPNKTLLFNSNKNSKMGKKVENLLDQVTKNENFSDINELCRLARNRKL